MLDDLNTPESIAALHAASKALNKAIDADRAKAKGMLLACGTALGILQVDPEVWFTGGGDNDLSADVIDKLIAERRDAKANRDFARADQIRDELIAAGIVLEDSPEGTIWRRA